MSRPKPKVLIEHVNKQTYKTEQILASEGIWAVYYQNRPINIKIGSLLPQGSSPKYKKVSFSNSGHAINLCKKLNARYRTEDFTVVFLSSGKKIDY